MSNIIPFESGKLPAYLKSVNAAEINSDLTSHAGTGFPVISIKGKVFAVVRDGERNVLTKNVDGEEIPAPSIDVVLIKANKQNSKVFYLKGYQEGVENQKPDCFSNDGTKPDASVEHPQSKVCATCPKNQWGSKIGDNGNKGKACQDSVRLAVAQPELLNDPYLLRVPPASIKPLGEYGKMLAKRGVSYTTVVTRIGFVMEEATPKLTFKATGFLSETAYNDLQDIAQGEVVQAILGSAFVEHAEPTEHEEPAPAPAAKPAPSKSKTVTTEEVEDAIAAAAPAKPTKPAKAKVEEVEVAVPELNLDDLNFDD
jgi:hypothetical protein